MPDETWQPSEEPVAEPPRRSTGRRIALAVAGVAAAATLGVVGAAVASADDGTSPSQSGVSGIRTVSGASEDAARHADGNCPEKDGTATDTTAFGGVDARG